MLCGGKCPTNRFFVSKINLKKTKIQQCQQHCLTVKSVACADMACPAFFWWVKQLCKDRAVPGVQVQAHTGIWDEGDPPRQLLAAARSQLFP